MYIEDKSGTYYLMEAGAQPDAPELAVSNSARIATVPVTQRSTSSNRHTLLDKCFPVDACGISLEEGFLQDTDGPPSESIARKVGAEFVGTFLLMFMAVGSAIVNERTDGQVTLLGLGAAPGLSVLAIILATGHISGAHLNPALTVAFAALRHFPLQQVPLYIVAQVLGSVCSCYVLKGVLHPDLHGGVTVPSGPDWQSLVMEFIITFNLMFVVTAVATDTRAIGELAALAVGATVMTNILIAGPTSGGAMNPVRALGPAIAAANYKGIWLYMVGPVLGALAGAAAYRIVRLKPHVMAIPMPPRASFVH